MSEPPTPEQIDQEAKKARRVAALVREHFDALRGSGFDESDAFELATNYHWSLLIGESEDED